MESGCCFRVQKANKELRDLGVGATKVSVIFMLSAQITDNNQSLDLRSCGSPCGEFSCSMCLPFKTSQRFHPGIEIFPMYPNVVSSKGILHSSSKFVVKGQNISRNKAVVKLYNIVVATLLFSPVTSLFLLNKT